MGGFVVFLLVLLIVAILLRIDFFVTIVYLFMGVYVMSRFWTQRIKKNLDVQQQFVDHVFSGDTVTLDITIKNAGWLPIPWLLITETLPVELTPPVPAELLHLGSYEERHITYSFMCRRRGYYSIGPLKSASGDLLGIMPRINRELARKYLIVYPKIVTLDQLGLPTRSPLAALPSRSPLFEDTTRVMGVRSYQPGDSMRRIHWTATARTGELLVKRYQPAIARETLICLDLNSADYTDRYTAPELAISVAASIAYHIIVRERQAAGLATEATDPAIRDRRQFYLAPRLERIHLIQMLEVLARVQTAQNIPFIELLQRERGRMAWGTTMTIITGSQSDELFETLIGLQRSGFMLALILVRPKHTPTMDRLVPRGTAIYRVWNEQDVEVLR